MDRGVSFHTGATVSQNPACQMQRFPPPAKTTDAYRWRGFMGINASFAHVVRIQRGGQGT